MAGVRSTRCRRGWIDGVSRDVTHHRAYVAGSPVPMGERVVAVGLVVVLELDCDGRALLYVSNIHLAHIRLEMLVLVLLVWP